MRGTLRGIEVERWGGEQAHRVVGSLKPLQDLHTNKKELSRPTSARLFILSNPRSPLVDDTFLIPILRVELCPIAQEKNGQDWKWQERGASERDCTRNVPSLLVIQGTLLLSVKNGVVLSPCKASPAMSENNRIDPLSAAYTTPIDRSDLHHILWNHEPTAAMAAAGLNARPLTHSLGHIDPSFSMSNKSGRCRKGFIG